MAERITISYSPTVYSLSIVTPSAFARSRDMGADAAAPSPAMRCIDIGAINSHGSGIVILDQARRAVSVELGKQRAVADMHLSLFEHGRHRHHQREFVERDPRSRSSG